MKVVVTGGAGFIGSHLVDRLLADGMSVTVVDDFSSGKRSNLIQHARNPRFRIVRLNLCSSRKLAEALNGIDAVFHLAAAADLRKSLTDHGWDVRVNVGSMLRLLEAMKSEEVPELVYSSTSSLYGRARVFPTPEDYAPTQTSLYGASKYAAEGLAEAFTELYDLKLWIYRFSNVIGERCRRGVVWDFVHKLLLNPKHLEILGDGRQSKEFLDVHDCVEGIIRGYQGARNKVNKINLAVPNSMTPDEVAAIVSQEMGLSGVQISHTGGESGWIGDNPRVELDTTSAFRLGWRPRVTSEESVRKMVRWILDINRSTG